MNFFWPISLALLANTSDAQPTRADAHLVTRRYIMLLRLDDQFTNCTGPGGSEVGPSRLRPHSTELKRLRAAARLAGLGAQIAAVDRHARRLIDAVDTSCIIGPEEKTSAAIAAYERGVGKAERDLANAIRATRSRRGE